MTSNTPVHAATGINHQINFQGKLVNPNGTNVTDGSYSIVFSIYTVAAAGSNIWTETQSVTVTNGIFQVNLGSVTALPGSVDFNTDNIYLGIKVGADAEMTPRVQFTSVPQAFNAEKLGGLDKTGFIQNQNAGPQAAANFNISGAGVIGTTLTTPTLQSAAATALTITGNAASTWSTSAGNITLQAGSGTISLGSTTSLTSTGALTITGGTTLSLVSTGTNAISLDSGTTGAVNIATNANGKTVQIGNTTAAVTQTINIGTNAFAGSVSNVLIGSTVGGTMTIQANGTINVNAPTVVGNATTQALFNTVATTINFGGAASVNIGAAAGTTTINGALTVAANKNVLISTGTGTLTQGFTSGVTGTAQTTTATNSNASITASTVTAHSIALVGNANGNANANIINGVNFPNVTTLANNAFYGLNFGTGMTDILRYNNAQIISGTGILQSAGLSGTYTNALTLNNAANAFTGNGSALTSLNGTNITSGLVDETVGGTGQSSYAVGDILYASTSTVLSKLADVATGSCLKSGGVGVAPAYGTCTTLTATNGLNIAANAVGLGGTLANSTTSLTSGGAASQLQVTSAAFVPTADQLNITNAGSTGVITAGVNGLSINYKGGAAAVEAAGQRIDLQPGTTSGGTWSALRIAPNATGAVAGVTEYGVKLDNLTTPGAGTESALFVGTGWDNILQSANATITQSGAVTAASFAGNGSALTSLNGTSISSGVVAATVGGTGQSSYAIGDLLYASSTTAIGKLAAVASGSCLISQGVSTAPIWGACGAGITSIGAYSTTNTSATGATIAGSVITFQDASASAPGMVGTGTQTFAGAKTFAGAAAGDALTVSNSTSVGNIAVFKDNATVVATIADGGAFSLQNSVNSTTGFKVQNAGGSSILGVNTVADAANLVTNGGFEVNTTGWALQNGAAISSSATASHSGYRSLAIATSVTPSSGAFYAYALTANTSYSLSMYAYSPGGNVSLTAGRTENGTPIDCASTTTITSSGWYLMSCSFTTGATIGGSPGIYVKQDDTTARTIYIDSVRLDTKNSGFYSPFREGNIKINGVLDSALLIQPTLATTNAFNVYDGSGNTAFQVDTINRRVTISVNNTNSPYRFYVGNGTSDTAIGTLNTGSGDFLDLKNNSGSVLKVTNAGVLQVLSTIDTTTAAALNIGTTNASVINLNENVVVASGFSLTLTGGNFASRPAGSEGMLYYDTANKEFLTFANGKWQAARATATKIVAASNSSQAAKDSADFVANGEDSAGAGIGTLDGDQIEINNALTAANAAGGGTVYLTEGTYTIDGSISIPNNVTLTGSGAATLIQMGNFGATSTSIFGIINTDAATGTGVAISNLQFDGRNSINTVGSSIGILMQSMGGGTGATARPGAKITNIILKNVRGTGIELTGSSNNTLMGNTSQGNTGGGFMYQNGGNNTTTNNISQGNSQYGFDINSSNYNVFSGNTAQGNTPGGFSVAGASATYTTITGNLIQTNAGWGIHLSSTSNNTVTGNTFQANTTQSISIDTSNNNTISGNKINDGNSTGFNNAIYFISAVGNTVTGNDITDSSCTINCFAINVTDGASVKNYLANNRFSSTPGTSSINDLGTGTVYANQPRAENGGQLTVRTANDTAAFQVQTATTGTAVLTVDTTNSQTILRGVSSDAVLGGELVTSQDFSSTVPQYWTPNNTTWTTTTTTAQHVTANTTPMVATAANFTPSAGATYLVSFQLTGNTSSGNTITPRIGGVNSASIGDTGTNTHTVVITASTTGALTFTPTTNFNGTISNVSVMLITLAKPALTVQNSAGTTVLEVRTSTQSGNQFIGYQAGQSNSTGTNNTADGYLSLQDNTSGFNNTASGYSSLQSNTIGTNNTASGASSLQSNTIGTNNTAQGSNSLTSNVTGNYNTASGYNSLQSSVNGDYNTALGSFSLQGNTTGGQNTAVGYRSLQSNVSGTKNTALGYYAGYQDPTVSSFFSLNNLTNSTALGYGAEVQASNTLILGGAGANAVNVGIGTTLPDNVLSVSPVQYSTGTAGTGGVASTTVTGSGTTWTAAMVGSKIIFANGSASTTPVSATITGFTNAATITVGTSITVAAGTAYRIQYQGLQVTSAGDTYMQSASATALQVKNSAGIGVLTVDAGNSQTVLRGTVSDAVLSGTNLITSNDYTTGAATWSPTITTWTGTSTNSAHVPNNTTALTTAQFAVTAGTIYQISFTVAGTPPAGSYIWPSIGGTNGVKFYGTFGDTQVIKATTTGSLTFTPTSAWNGTISAVSVKVITPSSAALAVQNSAGTTVLEVRAPAASSSTFIGLQAGRSNTSGSSNTGIGANALQSNYNGNNNTAVGASALQNNSNGATNSAFGTNALQSNTSGGSNTAMGANALLLNVTGYNNTAIGSSSLGSNTVGIENTAVGENSLSFSTTGNYNVAVGKYAGANLTTGSNVTSLGYQAGNQDPNNFATVGTLQNASAIGSYAQVQASNSLVLGSIGTAGATKVGVGTTIPLNTFSVSPLDYSTGTAYQSGTTITGTGTTWTAAMIGEQFIFADGSTATIANFTDATHLTASNSQTVSSTPGINYRIHKIGLQVSSTGQVGVGAATPAYALDVLDSQTASYAARIVNASSNTNADGLLIQINIANASRTTANYFVGFADNTGTIAGKIQGGASAVAYTTTGADYAEYFKAEANDLPQAGEIVALNTSSAQSVLRSTGASTSPLVGIVSTNPGFIGNGPLCNADDNDCDANYAKYNSLVALSGQVPAKVNASNGPIAIGDPITSSGVVGEGAKATIAGYIVGYAMEPLASGGGTIKVLVRPQFYTPAAQGSIQGSGLDIAGDASIGGSLNVSGPTTLTSLTVTGAATIQGKLVVVGDVETRNILVNGHIVSTGNAPTVVNGVAAGTGVHSQIAASASVDGTDTAGTVTINTADTVTSSGVLAEVTFAQAYAGNNFKVALTPTNEHALDLHVYVEKTATGFRIVSKDMAAATTQYDFDYIVIGAQVASNNP